MKDEKSVIVRKPKKVVVVTGMIDGASSEPAPEKFDTVASVRADKRKRLGFKA